MPVRVLWLIKGLGPGGAEQLLVSLAEHLPEDILPSAGYVVAAKDALVPDLERAGVEVRYLGAGGRHWVGALRRWIAGGGIDVVHAHSPLVAAAARLAVRTVPPGRRPAMLTTEHNAWPTYVWPTRLANALTAPLDDHTVAVSAEARASMPAPLRRRAEVLVHGVDLDRLRAARGDRAAMRAELGIDDGELLAVTVANYRAQKAYPNLLAAARSVLDGTDAPVRFASVGQGLLAGEIAAEHRRLGLGDRFLLLGHRTDVPAVLAAADLFILASTYEGLPVAVMEASALGLPIVATAVGAVPDVLPDGEAARLVPPGDPTALAVALRSVLTDDRLRARLAAGAAAASEAFDIRRVAARLAERYRALRRPVRRRGGTFRRP